NSIQTRQVTLVQIDVLVKGGDPLQIPRPSIEQQAGTPSTDAVARSRDEASRTCPSTRAPSRDRVLRRTTRYRGLADDLRAVGQQLDVDGPAAPPISAQDFRTVVRRVMMSSEMSGPQL